MRNREAAVRSRERKRLYVKNLEMKSRYLEGECRKLGYLLQCCYAENHALRLYLQSNTAFGASVAKLESAVLLMELLFCGSYLEILLSESPFMDGIMSFHRIPAAGFPAMVHGHHLPTQSPPGPLCNSGVGSDASGKHGTARPKKGGITRGKR